MKKGTTVSYTQEYAFGKVGTEVSKVMVIRGAFALLENGREICTELLTVIK